MIASTWLIASPWLLGFAATQSGLAGNDVLIGLVILMFTLMSFADASFENQFFVNGTMLLCGIALCVVAAISTRGVGIAFWNSFLLGVAIASIHVVELVELSHA
jgi:hypothetical protein